MNPLLRVFKEIATSVGKGWTGASIVVLLIKLTATEVAAGRESPTGTRLPLSEPTNHVPGITPSHDPVLNAVGQAPAV